MINGSGLRRFFQEKSRIRAARERTTGFSSKRFSGLCVLERRGATFPRLSGIGTRSSRGSAGGSEVACSIRFLKLCRTMSILLRCPTGRVCDRRWHHRPGASARYRRKRRDAQSGHRAFPRRLDDQDRRAGRRAGQSRAVRSAAGHDSAGVAPLLTDLDFSALLADKAFDSDGIRADLAERGAAAVIPPEANRVTTIPCDFEMYKWRHLVENFFYKIKEFRRIATRYNKTDTSFSAIIQLVGSVLAIR